MALGADVVNVYTGEVVRADVAVADGRIAAVGPDLAALAGPATERLDVRGKVLVPGFLDGHTHLDILVTLPALLREAIPRGLTALVTEMVQVTSALGVPGARWFLDTLRAQPIHAYATAPVISYLSAETADGAPRLAAAERSGALLAGSARAWSGRSLLAPARAGAGAAAAADRLGRGRSARRSRVTRRARGARASWPAPRRVWTRATSRSPPRKRSSGSGSACGS